MSDFKKYPSSAVNVRDIRAALHAGDPAIDAVTPPGVMVKATRTVLGKMVGSANVAIEKQQSGGSGTPNK
jgi:hypothetical protein